MSLEDLCSVHSVIVRQRVASSGASMGVQWAASPVGTMSCNVQQASASKVQEYASRGISVTHEIYTTSDPMLTVNNELVFGSLVLEVRGVRRRCDGDGVSQLWIIDADQVNLRPA